MIFFSEEEEEEEKVESDMKQVSDEPSNDSKSWKFININIKTLCTVHLKYYTIKIRKQVKHEPIS